jgi:DNA polymerase/3'-5' exonuclease PolX
MSDVLSPLSQYVPVHTGNQRIANAIKEYADHCTRTNDVKHRVAALKVSTSISSCTFLLTTFDQANGLANVGTKFAEFIVEASQGRVPRMLLLKRAEL